MLFMFFFFVAVLRSEKNFAFKFWEEFRLKYWLTNWKWCKWCNDVNIYDADDLNVNYINVTNDVDMTKLRMIKTYLLTLWSLRNWPQTSLTPKTICP